MLPGDVLIADEGNDRLLVVNPSGRIVWQFPRPGDLAPGTSFLEPDDAFFTPNAKPAPPNSAPAFAMFFSAAAVLFAVQHHLLNQDR